MKNWSSFWIAVIFCAGCAHGRRPEEKPVSAAVSETSSATPTTGVRVNLPYTFTRRGVDVRVYSIEFAGDKLVVTVSLRETRDVNVDLDAALLLKAQTPGGDALPFVSVARDGKTLDSAVIHFTRKEQTPATLSFQVGANAGKPVTLNFPTGKWWSSVGNGAQ